MIEFAIFSYTCVYALRSKSSECAVNFVIAISLPFFTAMHPNLWNEHEKETKDIKNDFTNISFFAKLISVHFCVTAYSNGFTKHFSYLYGYHSINKLENSIKSSVFVHNNQHSEIIQRQINNCFISSRK